jgi:hypothetical protein
MQKSIPNTAGNSAGADDSKNIRRGAAESATIPITDVPEAFSSAQDIVKRASGRRRAHFLFTFLSAFLLIIVVANVSISASISLNSISFVGVDVPLDVRYSLIDGVSRFLLFTSISIWLFFVFLDGWFLYPPSNPIRGRRGTTRDWFNAITFMVNQEPAEITEGLTAALNASLNSKIRSAHIFIWGLALLLSFLAIIIITIFNTILVDDYFLHLSSNVHQTIHFMQRWLIYFISFGQTTIGGRTEFQDGNFLMLTLFLSGQLMGAWIGFQLLRNAVDMRWSLLTTPDILYMMLKNMLLIRNDARDYDLDDAIADARYQVFRHGIDKTPEDFVDMDGRLFFYSDNAREAFQRSGRPSERDTQEDERPVFQRD